MEERVKVLQSDVYSALSPHDLFDVIYWNTPFGYVDDSTPITTLEKAIFDPGYKSTAKFINGAKAHLKEGGKLLVGFSSTLGDLAALQMLAQKDGFDLKLIAETIDPDSPPDKKIKLELFQSFKSN